MIEISDYVKFFLGFTDEGQLPLPSPDQEPHIRYVLTLHHAIANHVSVHFGHIILDPESIDVILSQLQDYQVMTFPCKTSKVQLVNEVTAHLNYKYKGRSISYLLDNSNYGAPVWRCIYDAYKGSE